MLANRSYNFFQIHQESEPGKEIGGQPEGKWGREVEMSKLDQ